MLKAAMMGLIFRGFRCGESKEGALVLADEVSSELGESNMALNFDDLWLAGICTPALSIPFDIKDQLGPT